MTEEKPEEGRDRAGTEGGVGRRQTDRPKRAPSGRNLTERQRREARELRRKRARSASRRRPGRSESARGPISTGIRTTAVEASRAVAFLARGTRTAAASLLSLVLVAAGSVIAGLGSLLGLVGRLAGSVAGAAARAALVLDRVLTPARAVVTISALAGVMLLVSQFLDYRAIEIGASGYDPILDLTRAPRTDAETPIGTHSVTLVVAAVAALGCCAAAALTGRRVFALVIAGAGVLTLAVGLGIDLPKGLDSAAASAAYADARAILLPGFWLQIASGTVLLAGGVILALGPAGAPSRAASAGRREAARRRRRATARGTA